jgi:hypothetical protein
LGNACYYSVQSVLSSLLLPENLNIKVFGIWVWKLVPHTKGVA